MKSKSKEKGQALILIALAAVGLFAFAALAIDGSRSYSNKRHAQNAADTSVLAGALAAIRCTNGTPNPCSEAEAFAAARDAAILRATSNGYTDNGGAVRVEVNLCSDPGITCEGIPTTATAADKAEYLRVRIVSTIPATFGRVIGRQTLQSAVEAIARVQGSSSFSSNSMQAVVGLGETGCSVCNNGDAILTVNNSGIFSNSIDSTHPSCAIDFWGNSTVYSQSGFTTGPGGGTCLGSNVDIVNGSGGFSQEQQLHPVYNIPEPSITCSANAAPVDNVHKIVHAGHYSSTLQLNGFGTYTFEAGNYCFDNGVFSQVNVIANDVNFRIDGGEFRVNGDNFTCSNATIFGAGGSGMSFHGNGITKCSDVTFYMKSGDVTWNGNSDQDLKARTSGLYKGLLIYLPAGNAGTVKLNGNSGSQMVGSVIAPGSTISLNGNAGSTGYDSQFVGNIINIAGNSNTVINFNPANQYAPPASPTIQLTK